MPGFHVSVVGYMFRDRCILYVSESPGCYGIYRGDQPIVGFVELPVDYMSFAGRAIISKEALYEEAAAKDPNYFAACIYGNYSGGLDLFVRIGDAGSWLLYGLEMPAVLPAGRTITEEFPWPRPTDWFYAVRKRFVRRAIEYDPMDDDDFVYDGSLFE